nr:asparaginase [Bacillota bacterium]
MAEPMVELFRGGYLESVHLGDIAAVGQDGRIIAKLGDPGMRTFWRSAAKPIQALIPFMSGAVEEYGISDEEYAVVCASHFGEEIH